jgi:hypothetical protein
MDAVLAQYLAIPYVAEFYSVERDGRWVRCGEYPELGCTSEGGSELVVMENLEIERVRTLVRMVRAGERPPEPRAPLTSGVSGLSALPLEELLARAIAQENDRVR